MRMEVLLVRLARGFDAKCERGGCVTSYVPPPKAQWKGHVYFLGGALYVNILFASPAGRRAGGQA